MKKLLVAMAVAVFVAIGVAQSPAGAVDSKLTATINKLAALVNQPIQKWQMADAAKMPKEDALNPATDAKKFKRIGLGYLWSPPVDKIWVRAKFTVPEKVLNVPVEGTKITLSANVEDYCELYVNGQLKQSFSRSAGNITLTEKAKPGEEFFVAMLIARNGANNPGMLREVNAHYAALAELERKVAGFNESLGSVDTVLAISGEKPAKFKPYMDKASAAIDVAALQQGDLKKFYASMDTAINEMKPVSNIIKQYSMYLVAYSHIDPAWLWDKSEGENIVWKGTSEEVLGLMKEFPRFVYIANQMHCYRWMKNDYPELFKKIQAKIKTGQWEPTGAEWVEPDGNLPAGESYVRQFLYGRKFSRENLGFVSTIGLTPDSFGYNWGLPQILRKCDMRGFITQKISWNDTTRFPYHLFWWESPDGSRVLVYFPEGGYGESVHAQTMATQLFDMKAWSKVDSNLVLFGVGDHGGGIPRDYLERAFALKDDPLYPKIEFLSPEKVFDKMYAADKTAHFPVWDTELYLEYHRGTYTTQARTKNNNRRNEIRLMNSERFSTIAALSSGAKYQFDKIEEAWKILLFNQFHDILPGSSITPVYKDSEKDHAWIAKQTSEVTGDAMTAIASKADTTGPGTPLVLFNGLSWKRSDVVEVPLADGVTEAAVYDEGGKEVPVQIIDRDGSVKAALFIAKDIPAMGYAVYSIAEGRKSSADAGAGLVAGDNALENDFYKIIVDPKTGWVTSILDKKNNKQILESGKAGFELMAYQERPDSDAWDPRFTPGADGVKPPVSALMKMADASAVKIIENGPVRVTIVAERDFSPKTSFKSYYSLVKGMPVIYGRLDASWHETNVFLKSAFNLNLDADYATFEVPYASIRRVAKAKTIADLAKWEMSGHRWVDYTDKSGKYGVSLLSFSKYGYDVKGNVLRMTMLRCPTGPDPMADRGNHSIPYALYPHTGDWTAAHSPLKGAEYNDPIIVFKTTAHPGKMGKKHGFFSAGPADIVIPTIKRSEDGKGFIIRLFETENKDTVATITLPSKPKSVTETNLVERELKKLPAPKNNVVTVKLSHGEIKTIKVVF